MQFLNNPERTKIVCPDCKGSGKEIDYGGIIFSLGLSFLSNDYKEDCKACDGKGYRYL